jgi:hypothetical protein
LLVSHLVIFGDKNQNNELLKGYSIFNNDNSIEHTGLMNNNLRLVNNCVSQLLVAVTCKQFKRKDLS